MARVGIIGRGWGLRSQEPNWKDAGLDVVAVVPREEWGALIARSDIDLVSVTSTPAEHVRMASAALIAGNHVVSEKPMSVDLAQAEFLAKTARDYPERIAIIDHELRFVPSYIAARERIAEIGPLRYAEVRYSSPAWDRPRPWKWWNDAAEGGGVWNAVGSHFIDTLRYLGFEVDAVHAMVETAIRERTGKEVTADDLSAVQMRMRGGAFAMMTFSSIASGPDEPSVLTLHGEIGAFRFVGEELLFAKRGEPYRRIAGDDLAKRPGNSAGGAFGTGTYLLGIALKRAIDDGDRSAIAHAATFDDGLAVQRVLDAARRSHADEGRWVPVEEQKAESRKQK